MPMSRLSSRRPGPTGVVMLCSPPSASVFRRRSRLALLLLFMVSHGIAQEASPARSREGESTSFVVEEATISDIHRAFRSGELSAVKLVDIYLERIAKYDAPNDLKAFVVLNPKARERAATLDENS